MSSTFFSRFERLILEAIARAATSRDTKRVERTGCGIRILHQQTYIHIQKNTYTNTRIHTINAQNIVPLGVCTALRGDCAADAARAAVCFSTGSYFTSSSLTLSNEVVFLSSSILRRILLNHAIGRRGKMRQISQGSNNTQHKLSRRPKHCHAWKGKTPSRRHARTV